MKVLKIIVIGILGIVILSGIVVFGIREYNYRRNLVDVVDEYFQYGSEVARIDLEDDLVLLYHYTEGTDIRYSVLKKNFMKYEYVTGGGLINLMRYRVTGDEKFEDITNNMSISGMRTEEKIIICGDLYNNIPVEKVFIGDTEANFVAVDETFNVNIQYDLENVRVFYAVFDIDDELFIGDKEIIISAYDAEGNIVKEHISGMYQ